MNPEDFHITVLLQNLPLVDGERNTFSISLSESSSWWEAQLLVTNIL